MPEKWIPFLYQYGVGGLLFFVTLWAAKRSGALKLDNYADLRLLAMLVGGFFAFLAIHGLWIAAIY